MPKCFAVLLMLGLAGCSGAPLMSSGLSAEPGSTGPVADYSEQVPVVRRAPARRVAVERVRQAPIPSPNATASNPADAKAEAAAKVIDDDVQRLERAARAATSSICRGC